MSTLQENVWNEISAMLRSADLPVGTVEAVAEAVTGLMLDESPNVPKDLKKTLEGHGRQLMNKFFAEIYEKRPKLMYFDDSKAWDEGLILHTNEAMEVVLNFWRKGYPYTLSMVPMKNTP